MRCAFLGHRTHTYLSLWPLPTITLHAHVRAVSPMPAQLALYFECIIITARATNKHLNFTHALRDLNRLDLSLISGNLSKEITFGKGSTMWFPKLSLTFCTCRHQLLEHGWPQVFNTYSNFPSLSVPHQVLPYEVISN